MAGPREECIREAPGVCTSRFRTFWWHPSSRWRDGRPDPASSCDLSSAVRLRSSPPFLAPHVRLDGTSSPFFANRRTSCAAVLPRPGHRAVGMGPDQAQTRCYMWRRSDVSWILCRRIANLCGGRGVGVGGGPTKNYGIAFGEKPPCGHGRLLCRDGGRGRSPHEPRLKHDPCASTQAYGMVLGAGFTNYVVPVHMSRSDVNRRGVPGAEPDMDRPWHRKASGHGIGKRSGVQRPAKPQEALASGGASRCPSADFATIDPRISCW